jgi:hypothetical protein
LICEDHLLAAIFKYRDESNYVLKLFEEELGVKQEHLLQFIKDIKHTDVIVKKHGMADLIGFNR